MIRTLDQYGEFNRYLFNQSLCIHIYHENDNMDRNDADSFWLRSFAKRRMLDMKGMIWIEF